MSFWRKICCCFAGDDINVGDNTRLLPKSEKSDPATQKLWSPYIVFIYGVGPTDLHLKRIPDSFGKQGIIKIACGSDHVLFLTEVNYVLSAGNNTFGQCARDPKLLEENKNNEEIVQETRVSEKLSAFNIPGFKIVDIAAGSYHSLILVKEESSNGDGVVMAFGHETGCGFLDRENRHIPTEVPLREKYSESVTSIFAGQMRSAAVLQSGKILIWGEWFNGLKQREAKELQFELPAGDSLKRISMGKMHVILLTQAGKVYSVGDNTYGELGFPREITYKQAPSLIPFFKYLSVLDVATGARHSVVLEESGKVYAFGDNSEGQCGIDANRSYEPQEIETRGMLGESDVTTRFIFCGDSHSALLTSEGDLFAWGDNTAGRLGIKSGNSIFRPRMVDELIGRNICAVGLGGTFSSIIVGPYGGSLQSKTQNILNKHSGIENSSFQLSTNE